MASEGVAAAHAGDRLCRPVLRCAMLHGAVLCYATLCCGMLRCARVWCVNESVICVLCHYIALVCQPCIYQLDVPAGDAVVLERWSDDRFTLHMHIIKNASDSMVAAATTKGKAKRSTARTTQRRTRAESPGISVLTSRQAPKPYSPGSLEALHDAALLCANSPSPDPTTGAAAPLRQDLAPSLDLADSSGGSSVPAAAVLAADAAAVQQQASELGLAAGFTARKGNPQQHSVCHRNGTAIGLTALHRHTSREET